VWQIEKNGRGVAVETVVIITVSSFLFGIIVGSFLNVCITRIPEGNVYCYARLALPAVRNSN